MTEKDRMNYMTQITLPKNEYEQLKRQAAAYRRFAAKFFESIIKDPIDQVVEDFRRTNLYAEGFLKDLESGLRKSSYTKTYENKAAQKRR